MILQLWHIQKIIALCFLSFKGKFVQNRNPFVLKLLSSLVLLMSKYLGTQSNLPRSTMKVNESEMFEDILKSVGIDGLEDVNTNVPAALNEYAKRLASELLIDAKDYATFASRNDINTSDMRMAIRMHDITVAGAASTAKQELNNEINQTRLPDIPDTYTYTWPENGHLLVQPHTYIPASEAANINNGNSNGNNGSYSLMNSRDSLSDLVKIQQSLINNIASQQPGYTSSSNSSSSSSSSGITIGEGVKRAKIAPGN